MSGMTHQDLQLFPLHFLIFLIRAALKPRFLTASRGPHNCWKRILKQQGATVRQWKSETSQDWDIHQEKCSLLILGHRRKARRKTSTTPELVTAQPATIHSMPVRPLSEIFSWPSASFTPIWISTDATQDYAIPYQESPELPILPKALVKVYSINWKTFLGFFSALPLRRVFRVDCLNVADIVNG